MDLDHLVGERGQVADQPAMRLRRGGDELAQRERELERPLRGVHLVVEIALDLAAPLALVDHPVAGIGPQALRPPLRLAMQREMSLGGDALVERLDRGAVGQHQPPHAPGLLGFGQHGGGDRELLHDLDHPVPELPIVGATPRVERRKSTAALAHLAECRAHERFRDAAPAVLRRDRDRADAGDRHALASHVGRERIEHERRHRLAVELPHPHVAESEARMVGVELAALLDARHAIGARRQVGERLDIGAAGRAVSQRRLAGGARGAHGG